MMARRTRLRRALTASVLIFAASGCVITRPVLDDEQAPASALLQTAGQHYERGQYTQALIACIDLQRVDPNAPGLAELRRRVMEAIVEQRRAVVRAREATAMDRMSLDVHENRAIPETYGLRRGVTPAPIDNHTAPAPMEQALEQPVSVHLEDVTLKDFILAIGESEGINIIADSGLSEEVMTLHADEVPLIEVLHYVGRNLGVQFSVGSRIIWVTAGDAAEGGVPLETRLYRLRQGLSGDEILAGREGLNIIEAINRFVPALEGSDLLFDPKAHLLIVRNTRENLSRVETLIEALDVCPPQVLIEARFISTTINDLSELGIDWVLNSPWSVTEKRVVQPDGSVVRETQTQVDSGATIGFVPFANQAQGMNFAYQGILTDPMFQATLHALKISGRARTLSVPKVTTVNNRAANIRIGEDFRYFEEFDIQSTPTSVTESGTQVYSSVLVPVGSPTLEELGIELNVTPSVGGDLSTISLQIVPEISEFVRYESYEVATGDGRIDNAGVTNGATSLVKLPIFRRSYIETEVHVRSGETVVMGGLISSSENTTENKVPILSSIPLLGALFRHDEVENVEQNLLIFVTASILSDRGENLVPVGELSAAGESPVQAQ